MFIYLWAAGSAAFFRRPVWEQTIGKQSNERPFQKHPALPDASGKTFRKSVRSSINLLQPSPGVRCAVMQTLSILRVKKSLPPTVSADTTTPRSLSLETRPLISCLRSAPPNRRSGDCKMTVGGVFVGPFGPQKHHPQTLLVTCYGDKVEAKLKLRDEKLRRRFFIFGTTPAVPQKESESHSRF